MKKGNGALQIENPLQTAGKGIKNLAEMVILEAIEDFLGENSLRRLDSIDFFRGEEFTEWARLAGIPLAGRLKILELLES